MRYFYGLFFAPKKILTVDNYDNIQEHKIFTGVNDTKRLLDRSQYFDMLDGKKISAMLPKNWKKSFNNGIVKPPKTRFCNECCKENFCDRCHIQNNENKEIRANINPSKRQALKQVGYMLPFFNE